MSYSLYLLHLPILYMLAYTFGDEKSGIFLLVAAPIVLLICYLFSRLTEANTYYVRSWIENMIKARGLGTRKINYQTLE